MRNFQRNMFVCLAVLVTVMFFGSTAFAKSSFEGGEEGSPSGRGDDPAGGTKLTGVLFVCYEDVSTTEASGGATLVLRLQREKSTLPTVFHYRVDEEIDFSDPTITENLFRGGLEDQVKGEFFPGEEKDFEIKSLKKQGTLVVFDEDGIAYEYVLVDIEISAK